ncbi:MAG: TetR/AcrR family transcriptional regulator [Mesorhizobium sp.]
MGKTPARKKTTADQKSSDRIEQIKSAAEQIFASKGFAGTSMQDIADACDISKALLYHHFESKDQIYVLVATEAGKKLYSYVDQRIAGDMLPSQRLRLFMIGTAEHFHRNRWAWIASTNAFWSGPERKRHRSRVMLRDKYEHQLRDIIKAGVDAGEIDPATDVAMAGRLVLSSLNWMHRWYNPDKELLPQDIAEQYFKMIFNGIRARP